LYVTYQPEGKKIKEINPIEGAMKTLKAIKDTALYGKRERGKVFKTKENGWIVDTCIAFDTKTWETGIFPPPKETSKCVIVEQYHNEEEAEKGHERWVNFMRENPHRELKDINVWDFKSLFLDWV